MKTIIFTKKYLALSAVFVILLIGSMLSAWFLFITPKNQQLTVLDQEKTQLSSELAKNQQISDQLTNNKNLMESAILNNVPQISEGIQIKNYLIDLKSNLERNNMKIKKLDAEDILLYKSEIDPQKKVFLSQMVLAFSANDKNTLFHFLESLENGQRFVKISDYSYKFSEDSDDFPYEITLIFNLYYLETQGIVVDQNNLG